MKQKLLIVFSLALLLSSCGLYENIVFQAKYMKSDEKKATNDRTYSSTISTERVKSNEPLIASTSISAAEILPAQSLSNRDILNNSFQLIEENTSQDIISYSSKARKEKPALSFSSKEERKLVKKQLKKEINSVENEDRGGKNQLVALLLAILVGGLGIHRFYLGYTTIGIIQLLTLGGCGIWSLVDIIRIATGDLKPKKGNYTKEL